MDALDLFLVFFLVLAFAGLVCALVWFCLKKSPKSAERFQEKTQELASTLGKEIVEVKLLGAGSADHRSVGGALVGGMVAGPLGAVIGGTQGGKGKQKQRFAVKYDDGSVEIKEVRVNSAEYKNLMKYVNWDDIR